MGIQSSPTSRRRKRVWGLTLVLLPVGLAVWWLLSPSYIDLNVPFEPTDSAWGAKSYITLRERAWNGGGTYYVVRLQGHAREREGWTREKAIDHFDGWLIAHGWQRVGKEEEGAGVFYHWSYGVDATHFRYRRKDARASDLAYVSLTVLRDEGSTGKEMGARMWNVVLESVQPSWWTSVVRNLD